MSPQFKPVAEPNRWLLLAAAFVLGASPQAVLSQERRFFFTTPPAGSGVERYLRATDLLDSTTRRQWTIRPLATSDPMSRMGLTEPSVSLTHNTSFPYGFNDGPAWAGKGITAAVSAGAELIRPHLSITLAPVAFIAQNAEFAIGDNGLSGDRRFADLLRPDAIDLPQRFGSKSYAAFNPGESEVAVRGFGVTGGLSSRSQIWGPAYEHPLILGNNAGGIPRLFAGTSSPVDLRWITIHGQIFWGQLDESAFGSDTGAARRHFATAAIGTLGIRRLPGLELGLIRFFHTSWPADGISHASWLRVVHQFVAENVADNQLASVFIRVAPPGSGFEVFAEFAKEDGNENLRDLQLEPDHGSGYTVGFARSWPRRDGAHLSVLRGEVSDTRVSHLQQRRSETPMYMHTSQSHGHTEHGQVLGSAGAYGGGASNLSYDRYTPSGRTTVRWDRIVRATPFDASGLPLPAGADVIHAIAMERARNTGRGELAASIALVKNLNRYFSSDAMNAALSLSYRLFR
jgi:hypothetical protein